MAMIHYSIPSLKNQAISFSFLAKFCRITIDVLQRGKIKDDEWEILWYS